MAYLIVFLGAGIGGSLRHFVNVLAMRLGEPTYVGTAFINITGSLLIGLFVEYFALKSHLPRRWLLFITTGIMGGYTTFSTFSLETVLLVERSQYVTAFAYVVGSFVLSVGATFSAFWILRSLLGGH